MTIDDWILPSILTYAGQERAVQHLERYYILERYSGLHFDSLGGGANNIPTADIFTSDDILAVQFLSVSFKRSAILRLLDGEQQAKISSLLRETPRALSLETREGREALTGSPTLLELWANIRSIKDIGVVKASKILARKRPHLIPIYDQYVASEFNRVNPSRSWRKYHWDGTAALFGDGDFVSHLNTLRNLVPNVQHLSLLRVMDVVL